jgi:hypothetical protein
MSKRRLALAPSIRSVPQKGRARRNERQPRGAPARREAPAWTDLEAAFFAAAPPDDPAAAAAPERFDDLDPAAPARDGAPLMQRIAAAFQRLVGVGS